MAAIVPNVPGATGARPEPNPYPIRHQGFENTTLAGIRERFLLCRAGSFLEVNIPGSQRNEGLTVLEEMKALF